MRQEQRLHARLPEVSVVKRRRESVSKAVRFNVLKALVDELREHGREGMRDADAVFVRVVARTGLSRAEVQAAASELLPLLRELIENLRREGR
jgi:hypothetical protein